MLRRYRIALFATFVISVMLLWAIFQAPREPTALVSDRTEAPQAEYSYKGAYKSGEGFSFSVRSENDLSASTPSNSYGNAVTIAEANLLAQEQVAYWTLWIGVFTAAGLIALIFAFDETRQMTIATRDIGEAQLRPYPLIRSSAQVRAVTQSGGLAVTLQASIPIFNAGQTPVFDMAATVCFHFWQPGRRIFSKDTLAHKETFKNIAPLAQDDEYIWSLTMHTTYATIDHFIATAKGAPFEGPHRYIRLEIMLEFKDYAGRPQSPLIVSMQSDNPFTHNSMATNLKLTFPEELSQLSHEVER